MELEDAKAKFLHTWGTMGSVWGINRTMAQVHALLLISPKAKSADEIMEELKISRGNANLSIRALIDWGLLHKELRMGDRREYFNAEKDIWKVVTQIIVNRKKKELEPAIRMLDELSSVEGDSEEAIEFMRVVKEMRLFAQKADKALDSLSRAHSSWIFNSFLKGLY